MQAKEISTELELDPTGEFKIELSDEDLSQVGGGGWPDGTH